MIYLKKNNNNFLLNTLINFGAHLGDFHNYKHYSSIIFYYIHCIRNDFFIFDLQKTVFFFQRACYFIFFLSKNLGKILFYHSSIEESYFFRFIFFYLIKYKTNNSYVNYKWTSGLISNYKHCFVKFINILYTMPDINTKNPYQISKTVRSNVYSHISKTTYFFRYLFFKLLYLTYEKTFLRRDWRGEFSKLLTFWRAFIYIRSFKSIFNIHDCLICINPSNNGFPVSEFSKNKKIPSISLLDTSTNFADITYPIPSNDDSVPLSLFYISIFLNIWLIGNYLYYNDFNVDIDD